MAMYTVEIAVNRYAPQGSESINLYSYDYASNLTLSQLMQAVCLRAAAASEAQSVIKMNMIAAKNQTLDEAADWLQKIVDGSANWSAARNFLVASLGIPSSALPDNIDSYDKRMRAAAALQDKIGSLSQLQQQNMIDLQTLVNRRDVAYSTGSGVARTLAQSMTQDAQNF